VKCSSKKVIYFSESCQDTSVSFGSQSDSQKTAWALSATATAGVVPTSFPIFSAGSRDKCASHRNLAINSKGKAQLSGATASFGIIPKNASDCNSQVYLQVVGGTKTGEYLSYGDCNSKNGFITSKSRTFASLWKLTPTGEADYPVQLNHENDEKVTKSYMAAGVTFHVTPVNSSIEPWNLLYGNGIVYAGANDANRVISFICPQSTKALKQADGTSVGVVTTEVNIKNVGGIINPKSGAAIIHLLDIDWMIWGEFSVPGMAPFNLTKENAATIGIVNEEGVSELQLGNIAKTAEIASAVGVQGFVGEEAPNQTEQQLAVLDFMATYKSKGLYNTGTKLQWNIYLQQFTVPQGSEYVDIAHDHEM
jgi:hypothetical protein